MAEIDSSVVAGAIGLPPEKAIAYFRAKGYKITWDWEEQAEAARKQAFTIAKAVRLDILQDVKGLVQKALDEGVTMDQFRKELEPKLRAKGWWGRQVVAGPDGAEVVQLGSPHRLEVIYRTNMQSAYMAGRRQEQEENADERPYLQYVAVADASTRPSHLAMNGKIYPINDPVWSQWTPPCGYNCFPPETPVATPTGWRPIGSIRPGDVVIGGSGNRKTVIESFRRPFKGEISRIVLDDGGFSATKNHRVLTMRGWVSAGLLVPGDVLIQIPECAKIDPFVGDVNQPVQSFGDPRMTSPGNESAAAHAFDPKADFWDHHINPVPRYVHVENRAIPKIFQVANHLRFALGRFGDKIRMGFRVGGIVRNLRGDHLSPHLGAPGGRCFAEALGSLANRFGILFGLSKARAATILVHPGDGGAHLLAGRGSALGGINPLGFDRLPAVADGNSVDLEHIQHGVIPHPPTGAEVPSGKHFLDVEGPQGFGDGAPLDRFDSLDSFRAHAKSHWILREVKGVQNIHYTGTVCNLEIVDDNTYCIPSGVVHNCRCRTRALTPEQAEKKGGVSQPPKVKPDPGFGGTRPGEQWEPDMSRYSPDIRRLAEND